MQGFVRRRFARRIALLALAGLVSACGPRVDKTAAPQVVVFLNAARTGDRMAFEAHIDRRAVREDVRGQLADLPGVKELQAQLGEGMSEGALDRMATPAAILRLEKPKPGAVAADLDDIRPRLKAVGDGRVCLRDPDAKDRCLLTFDKDGQTWKLVGIHAERQSFTAPGAGTPMLATALAVED